MTRRLRMAGTAFGAFLVPACMTTPPAGGVAPPRHPSEQVGAGYRPMPGALAQAARKPREQFAAGREQPATSVAARPSAVPDTTGIARVAGPVPEEAPMPRPVEPAPAPPAAQTPVPTAPPMDLVPTAPEPPRPLTPLLGPPAAVDPGPDADAVIRPPRPVIPGAPPLADEAPPPAAPTAVRPTVPPAGPALPPVTETSRSKTEGSPALLIPPAVGPAPIAPIPPATGPVIGSSVHEAKASPISTPILEPPAPEPRPAPAATAPPPAAPAAPTPAGPGPAVAPGSVDSPLLMAVRAFQANRPDEAVEHLKAFDPATQQVLLRLMPAMVRLTEGKLQQMKPEEMDQVLDQLAKVTPMLRPRASLQATNVRLCREVHTFAHVEPYAATHTFRPGDVVVLYMELANYTAVPDGRGGFTIELSSGLELRDAADAVAWRADPKDVPDRVSTPPQDYYRAFRMAVPNVPPGTYKLAVKTADRPSGREVRKAIPIRIGSR